MSKTIEEKAIAYDKAIEKAREYWETDDDNTLDIKARGTMEYLFPELIESEGERIRRLLISGMKNLTRSAVTFASVPIKDIIDWLEKQGEQTSFYSEQNLSNEVGNYDHSKVFQSLYNKPTSWSEEDERMFDYALDMIEWYSGKNGDKSKLVSDWLKFLKDRVQPQNWTKEDKERYISCLQRLSTGNPEQPETINSKWFKEHVYPQKQGKPSDEQMCAFKQMYDWYNTHFAQSLALNSLYNDLKKLKGE